MIKGSTPIEMEVSIRFKKGRVVINEMVIRGKEVEVIGYFPDGSLNGFERMSTDRFVKLARTILRKKLGEG